MKYRLSTLLLLVLCIATGIAWYVEMHKGDDKNQLCSLWCDETGTAVVLAFDQNGAFSKKEFDPGSGLIYTQYFGTYRFTSDSTLAVTITSSKDYSWSGGDEWDLDNDQGGLNFDVTYHFAINNDVLILSKAGGRWSGPHGGTFTRDGG